MNLKNLFKSTLCVLFSLLVLSSCNGDDIDTNTNITKEEAVLVGNCKKSDMSAIIMEFKGGALNYRGASKININKLHAGGTHILGVRAYIPEAQGDVIVFAGEDKNNPVATKTASATNGGWQYILFDEPVEVTTSDMYIGFEATSKYLAIEKANSSRDEILDGQTWVQLNQLVGGIAVFPLQAIMTGGVYADRTQVDMLIDELTTANPWGVKGQTTSAQVLVRSNGVKTVKGVKVQVTMAGKTIEQTIDGEIMNGQSKLVTIDNIPVDGDGAREIRAAVVVESDNVTKNNVASDLIRVYPNHDMKRNTILVEQFTSQQCPNCPRGAEYLKNSIKGMKNQGKISWVAHHKGYYDDDFSIEESDVAARAMGVRSAPTGSINRMKLKIDEEPSLSWYLGSPTSAILDALATEPANSTLKLERTYNAETRELKVTVSGKSAMKDNNVTIIVTQSNMMAGQGGASGTYSHNFTPRFYMTAGEGDKVEVDADGNFTLTATKTVPEKVGKFNCVTKDMEVVAFVHGSTTAKVDARFVYNADKLPLEADAPAAIMYRALEEVVNMEITDDMLAAPKAVCVAE